MVNSTFIAINRLTVKSAGIAGQPAAGELILG
jgi:hypothetical protein